MSTPFWDVIGLSVGKNWTVGDGTDGYSFYVYRVANEGTNSYRVYINADQVCYMYTDCGVAVFDSANALSRFAYYGDLQIGDSWFWAGLNKFFRHYGYNTGAGTSKYVQWQVEAGGDFSLVRQDSNIARLRIDFPLNVKDASGYYYFLEPHYTGGNVDGFQMGSYFNTWSPLYIDGSTIYFNARGGSDIQLGGVSTAVINAVGRVILRTTPSDPQDATPANRPAGTLNEIANYSGKTYRCTNASTPTWEKFASS